MAVTTRFHFYCNNTCKRQGSFVLAVVQTSDREYDVRNRESKQKKPSKWNNENPGSDPFYLFRKRKKVTITAITAQDSKLRNVLVHCVLPHLLITIFIYF